LKNSATRMGFAPALTGATFDASMRLAIGMP
jgi:hypothetical protein